jgi:putative ubiquitin-RnfH superfamily antitoxin RatB of RatAB toxin-antitoxin module
MMRIEVVWMAPHGVTAKDYQVESPCTVEDALSLAARDPQFAHAGLNSATVGVFGRIVSREELLADGDRIEICRGPAVDAKLARRQRAGGSRGGKR